MSEEAAQVAAPEAEGPKYSPEVAEEARALGWKAPDEWQGERPPTYIDDPQRYLERAESFTPFKKLKDQQEAYKRETDDKLRRIEQVAERAIERERASHKAELERVKAEKLAAVENADPEAYKAAERREEMLRATEPKAPPAPDPQMRLVQDFASKNPWFD